MNYLTIYLVDLKARKWSEVGVEYSWGSVDFHIDSELYKSNAPSEMNLETSILVVMDDERKKCRFRSTRSTGVWTSPICADYDKFIAIIGERPQVGQEW